MPVSVPLSGQAAYPRPPENKGTGDGILRYCAGGDIVVPETDP